MANQTTDHHGRSDWPRRVGLLNDYLRIPYANGSSFASQFLYRELGNRGVDVTVLGPADPAAKPADLPRRHVAFGSVPLRSHPGVRLPLPTPTGLQAVAALEFDVTLAHTSSGFLDLGAWLRIKHDVPFICVNTVHLPSVYNVILPVKLQESPVAQRFMGEWFMPRVEKLTVANYNNSDGLIVLSEGLERYWRSRGITVPIHVIPRAVEPRIFDVSRDEDPFDPTAKRGGRLLCVCRHTREKEVERLLDVFAKWIAPAVPEATLTLVGDGPDHDLFRARARELGIADRTFFPGEFPVTDIPTFYRFADLFVYASLSETYGQVVSEALWCGLPVVAVDDQMGVSSQVRDGETGVLVTPGPDRDLNDWRFGSEVVALLKNRARRGALAAEAASSARRRVEPGRVVEQYFMAFDEARRHCADTKAARARQNSYSFLARWGWVELTVSGLGLLRPPAVVNRHGRRQPTWEALEAPFDSEANVFPSRSTDPGVEPRDEAVVGA
ncbi:MAG: glycosyltransferase [Polyangiaceae bacterium]|nr:glycosyltransferase [Polyangiaceae bacterium]